MTASRREFISGAAFVGSGLAMAALGTSSTAAQSTLTGGHFDKYTAASDRTVQWLLARLKVDGSFGSAVQEMTSYHKSAYLFGLAGETAAANAMLSHIKRRYLQSDGDFLLAPGQKRDKVDYNEKNWGYSNGWFTLAAHRLGRFDVSWLAWQYLQRLFDPATGGFSCTPPGTPQFPIVELLATAHMGMLALYFGDRPKAMSAAARVRLFESEQAASPTGMYLCIDRSGRFVTTYPPEDAPYYFFDRTKPGQFYFTPGYAAAFLANMYLVSGDEANLRSAIRYFDLTAELNGVFDTHFSHKMAWGASLLFSITGEPRFERFALRVADVILAMQSSDGAWFADQPEYVSFDQSAECAIWLRTIPAELLTRR